MPSATPALDPALAALLGRVWPSLPAAAVRAGALGFAWAAVSIPFVRREGGRVVGHVGLIELPLVVAGQPVRVGSIHAVCTDPGHRRGGLGGALMQEALAACAGRYETVVLTTGIPEFYARFGFRPVREHAFERPLSPVPRPQTAGGRVLGEGAGDLRLLRRLLAGRAPVSDRLGSLEGGTVFVVGLLLTWGDFSRVHYHPALDVATVHEVRERARACGARGAARCRRLHEPHAPRWPGRPAVRHGGRAAGLSRRRAGAGVYEYDSPIVSATRAGRGWPSTSMVISEVTRTPPWISSTLAMRWRSRTRAPAWTGVMKRTLLDP